MVRQSSCEQGAIAVQQQGPRPEDRPIQAPPARVALGVLGALVGLVLAAGFLWSSAIALADTGTLQVTGGDGTRRAISAASIVPTGNLSGLVTAVGGAPVYGVSVSVSAGPRSTTATDGSYLIAGIEEGTRTVTFAKTGYRSRVSIALISAGATTTLDAVLAAIPTTGTLRGRVSVSGGGPLRGARVSVAGGPRATTAADGTYTVRNVNPGTRTITFTRLGYVRKSRSARISAGATTTLNAALIQDGNLAGTVAGANRAPLAGIKVSVSAPGSHIVAYAKTWLGVRYVWGGTSRSGVDCSGLTRAVAREIGYHSFPRTAASQWSYFRTLGWAVERPRPGDFVYFKSPASPSGRHTAVYVSSDTILEAPGSGDYVKIARMPHLSILGYGRLQGGVSTTTTVDGRYSIPYLEPGTYSVVFNKPGWVSKSPATVVVSAKTTTLCATLKQDGALSGSVTTTGSAALSGATVSILGGRSTRTAADGRYSIPLVEPGTYEVSFAMRGYLTAWRLVEISAGATATLDATLTRPVPVTLATATRLYGPTGARVRRTLKLTGTVSRPAAPGKVTIIRTRSVGRKWKAAGSAKVAVVRGRFAYSFKPASRGRWRFIASYAGGVVSYTTYKASKSAARTVRVK